MRLVLLTIRLAIVLAAVAAVVALGWWATHRDEARAWRQAATIGAAWQDRDDLPATVLGLFAGEPQATRVRTAGSLPATAVLPGGGDPAPAVVLLVPGGTSSHEEDQVREAQRAIARAGIAAWAVRTPSNRQLVLAADARSQVLRAVHAIVDDPQTRDGHVSVAAVGPAASLVLRAAGDGSLDLRAAIAIQPIASEAGARALLPQVSGIRSRLLQAALPDLVRERSPLPVAGRIRARVLVVDDTTRPGAVRDDASAVARAIRGARTLAVDGSALDDLDAARTFEIARWWLLRAGE